MPRIAPRRTTLLAPDNRPVLADALLRPGFVQQDLSRYDDPIWDLSPTVYRENLPRSFVTVNFGAIPDPTIARALREYLYVRLNIRLPGDRRRLPPTGIRRAFHQARHFFEFVRAERGSCDIARVDQPLLDRYAKSLLNGKRHPSAVAELLGVIFDLYAYRTHLPTIRLPNEPWPGRTSHQVAGYRNLASENRTPRMPEEIITPLLKWSLKYVTLFAADILAARAELIHLEEQRAALDGMDALLSEDERCRCRADRLVAYLLERRRHGRGVPVWTTTPNGVCHHCEITGEAKSPINWLLLSQHVGLCHGPSVQGLVEVAVKSQGIEVGGMDTPISTDPETGQPWRSRFDARAVQREERMLQAACYVVCAYLTGMRDSEVQAMRSGCLSVARSADGIIERHRVRSVAYKGKGVQGEPTQWVTIAPVAEAIEVLERLSVRSASARDSDTLWPVLRLTAGGETHVSTGIIRQLNDFRDHLNALFGTKCQPVIPPTADGRPWHITTRQFRRTIAWHIANRPFGTIAGMIQYKHASVAAFEGYAGASCSGFRAEIEAQRRLGQLDDILAYFDSRQSGVSLSGLAAGRIGKVLDATRDEIGPLPGMIADRGRLRTLLASVARTLHVGILADCFFDPSTALCLKNATEPDRSAPLTTLCQPTRCPNACITTRHRPAWAQAASEAQEMLREKRLSNLQRTALKQDLARIKGVIDDLD